MSKLSFFLGQGGGSSDAELNIHYGTIAPTDTTKLWVKCNEPSKVLMNNNIGIQNGLLSQIEAINPLSLENSALGCNIYGNNIYFGRATLGLSNNGIYKKDLTTGVISRVGNENLITVVNGLNGKYMYAIRYTTNSSGVVLSSLLDRVDVSSDTITFIGNLSAPSTDSIAIYANNKVFYAGVSRNSLYCYNLTTNTDELFCVLPSGNNFYNIVYDGNKYIYARSIESSSPYANKLFRINIDSKEVIQIANLSITGSLGSPNLGYYNNSILFFFMQPSSTEAYMYSYNVTTNTFSKIDETNYISYTTLNYTNAVIQNGYAYFAANAKYSLVIPLANNNLAINFNTNNNRWKAININNLEVAINPVSVYLGNSQGEGVKQVAQLWNGSGWVNI